MSPESESEEGVKKLVSVSATFTPVTETSKEVVETAEAIETAKIAKGGKESEDEYQNLTRVPCIRYPVIFRKKSVSMSALLDLGSEINAIHPTFARELGLPIKPTDVGV